MIASLIGWSCRRLNSVDHAEQGADMLDIRASVEVDAGGQSESATLHLNVFLSYIGFKRYRKYNPWSVRILTWGGSISSLAIDRLAMVASNIFGV